jgi:hypothetical protein
MGGQMATLALPSWLRGATGAFAALETTSSDQFHDNYSETTTRAGHCEPVSLTPKL